MTSIDLLENLTNLLTYFTAFIALILIIVFIHEFGHYIVAKKFGVKIEVFSIGFGKKILSRTDKSGTNWQLGILPFGGYVKMFGDSNEASGKDELLLQKMSEEQKKSAFHYKPLYQKALIVAAGPAFNFILAIILLNIIFAIYGKISSLPTISTVINPSPAYSAGLKPKDKFISIDDEKVESFSDIQRIIALNTGKEVNIKIERDKKVIDINLTPKLTEQTDPFGNKIKTPILGITSNEISYQKLSLPQAFIESFKQTYEISGTTLKALKQMITGQRSIKEITGPIGIAQYSGQAAKQGFLSFFWLVIFISINLGLVNLFPIPVLDGGHLLYYIIEAIKGEAIADTYQQLGMKIGMLIIVLLSVFAILNDIRKFFI